MTINASHFNNNIILSTGIGEKLAISHLHFDQRYLQQQNLITGTAEGRGTVYFFKLNGTELVLRHYKRGGLVAKLNDDSFFYTGIDKSRCHKELSVLAVLREANINVPEPIAGRIVKKGLIYTADIITKVIPKATELHEILQEKSVHVKTWRDIGREIRKMHDAQICHLDINVKNILLVNNNGSCTVHLLDFDKCEARKGNHWKAPNVERLKRSLNKQVGRCADYYYQASDWEALTEGYLL
jgi:3-deoxy-D-manno-octulosonic acid kinase